MKCMPIKQMDLLLSLTWQPFAAALRPRSDSLKEI